MSQKPTVKTPETGRGQDGRAPLSTRVIKPLGLRFPGERKRLRELALAANPPSPRLRRTD